MIGFHTGKYLKLTSDPLSCGFCDGVSFLPFDLSILISSVMGVHQFAYSK